MNQRVRMVLFFISAVVLAAVLVSGVAGLPGFGNYPGPYGFLVNRTTIPERRVADVVTSVMFDQRGFDTLGEEFILFTAVAGVALLLREHGVRSRSRRNIPTKGTAAMLLLTVWLGPAIFFFGAYMTLRSHVSIGGGFQGGIICASMWLLVYLVGEKSIFSRISPKHVVEAAEALAAATYALIGIAGLIAAGAFLQNFIPLGQANHLLSGGTVPVINFAVGIEVTAAFVLLMVEFFLHEEEVERG